MAQVKCLYCDVVNDALATGGYCEGCGKKLPTSALVRTKRTLAEGSPNEEDRDAARRHPASEALLGAAVVYLVAGGMFLIVGPALMPRIPDDFLPRVLTWALLPAVLVAGLGGLARRAPRPAALLALATALVWLAVTFALDPGMALPWLLVQGALLALVGRAVWLTSRPATLR